MMYDAVVVGLGGMGSASAAHLAARGLRVAGVEQFARGHERGASTGQSRIIRMAYYEDPAYVPLLRRAYDLWEALEQHTGRRVIDLCGVLMAGRPDSAVLTGARDSAQRHGIPLDELTTADIARRYPRLELKTGERTFFEPRAGMVFPEAAVAAHLELAERDGADLFFDTRIASWTSHADAILLEPEHGPPIRARRLALCAGPWSNALAGPRLTPLRIQRNVQLWFEPQMADYGRDVFPAFFLDRAGAPGVLYGFPDYGLGVKAALHGYGEPTQPDDLDRAIHPTDIAPVAALLEGFMPGAAGALRAGKACMYSLTPDENFVIDTAADDRRIVVAAGFSGHGFKFCSVVGEIVADLIADARTRHPIGFLRLDRFSRTPA